MCRKYSPLENVFVVTLYEGVAEQLIKQLKFERARSAAKTVARAIEVSGFVPEGAVLVPVPTATSRVRIRGYDQSKLVANELSKITGMTVVQGLDRIGQQRQTGSSRIERKKQIEGAFVAKMRNLNGIKSVLLVDDVLTTGATVESAARTLRRAGVKHISALTFARAE
jgi:ComF family protein